MTSRRSFSIASVTDAIPEARQAEYYREAFALAACQPTVAGILVFHVADERDARAWQSGVYYANGTPKASLPRVRAAAVAAQAGTLATCQTAAASPLGDVVFHTPAAAPGSPFAIDLSCTLPCTYRAEVLDAQTGAPVAVASGDAIGQETIEIGAPAASVSSYQYALRVFGAGRPGTAVTRYSRTFTADAAPAGAAAVAPPALSAGVLAPFPAWIPTTPLPPALAPLPTLVPTAPAATAGTPPSSG